MMRQRILLINLLMLVGIVIGAQQLISAWKKFESGQNVQQVVARAQQIEGEDPVKPLNVEAPEVLQHDFFSISERDLFSATRRPAPVEDTGAEEAQPPEFPKRPEMTGAMSFNGDLSAFLVVFENPKSRGENRTVRVGDDVQGYAVTAITDTTVTLSWNDHQELIDMADGTSRPPKPRNPSAQVAAVNIVKIGSRYAAVETNEVEARPEGGEAGSPPVGGVGGGAPGAPTPISTSGRPVRSGAGRRVPANGPAPNAGRPATNSPTGVVPQNQG